MGPDPSIEHGWDESLAEPAPPATSEPFSVKPKVSHFSIRTVSGRMATAALDTTTAERFLVAIGSLREEIAELRAQFAANDAAGSAKPDPHDDLTIDEAMALRPHLPRTWFYKNAAACGAIRRNGTARSPLLFRLADIDAVLNSRRREGDKRTATSALEAAPEPRLRGPGTPKGDVTPNGAPRHFEVQPRWAA